VLPLTPRTNEPSQQDSWGLLCGFSAEQFIQQTPFTLNPHRFAI
jgi:hypothetical protein